MKREVGYVSNGDVHIAYQMCGSGDRDIVFLPSWSYSHVDTIWDHPAPTHFLSRLAGLGRLIHIDRRGVGASDRTALGPFEEHVDDLVAVLDYLDSDRPTLFGLGEGAFIAALFASTHPRRVGSLVLMDLVARSITAPDHEWGWTPEQFNFMKEQVLSVWGRPDDQAFGWVAPSATNDPSALEWWVRVNRTASSPSMGVAVLEQIGDTDVGDILGAISAPTLLLGSQGHAGALQNLSHAVRDTAERFRDAKFVSVPVDQVPFFGDPDALIDEIEEFLTGTRPAHDSDRSLATLLFTDVVDSTNHADRLGDRKWKDLLERHNRLVREQLRRFSGREITTTGDGFLATFDGPARAIRCACAVREAVRDLGIAVRAGLHTGEIERQGEGVAGIAVHIAARVLAVAEPDEVLVSRTVVDLVAGSGLEFRDRGTHALKGVPGDWRLFAVAAGAQGR